MRRKRTPSPRARQGAMPAPSSVPSPEEIEAMAQDAVRLGYTPAMAIMRLKRSIGLDLSYLWRRKERGTHTSHDDRMAEEAAVKAYVIMLLEERRT